LTEAAAKGPVQCLVTLDKLPVEEVTSAFSKQTFAGERQMIVWATLKKGAHAAAHCHPQEQIFWVTSGCMEVRILDKHFMCEAGGLITVPPAVEHEAWAREHTTFVSFLSGLRKDLLGPGVPEHFR